jgi:hypothetical protein
MALTPQQSADYQARIESAASPAEKSRAIAERNTALGFGTTKQTGNENVYTSDATIPSPLTPNQPIAKQTITYKTEPSGTDQTKMDEGSLPDRTSESQGYIDNAKATQNATIDFYTKQAERQALEWDNLTKDIADIDAELSPEIQRVKDTFAKRINEMGTTNKALQGQVALGNVRSGLARYAQATAEGLVSAETTAGMDRISELESQKMTAIQQAKDALKSNAKDKWKMFNEYMNTVASTYENKKKAVLDLAQMVKDEETAATTKAMNDLQLQKAKMDVQSDKADNVASGSVDVDEEGNIIFPTADDVAKLAEEKGIDPDILTNAVNERIDALKKIAREERGKISYYDEKGAGNKTIRHYFNENTGEDLYTKDLGYTYKGSSPSSTEKLTAEEKALQNAITKQKESLASNGTTWGDAYDYLVDLYGDPNPDLVKQLSDEDKQALNEQGIQVNEGDETLLDIYLNKSRFFNR